MKKENNTFIMKASKKIVNAANPEIELPICLLFYGKPKTSQKLTSDDFRKLSTFLRER